MKGHLGSPFGLSTADDTEGTENGGPRHGQCDCRPLHCGESRGKKGTGAAALPAPPTAGCSMRPKDERE